MLDAQGEAIEGVNQILFYSNVPSSVVGKNLGITSMQTSVFGGIIVGGSTA